MRKKENSIKYPRPHQFCVLMTIFVADSDQLVAGARRRGGGERGQQPPAPPGRRDSQGPALCQEAAAGKNKQSVHRKILIIIREGRFPSLKWISLKIFCNVGPSVVVR